MGRGCRRGYGWRCYFNCKAPLAPPAASSTAGRLTVDTYWRAHFAKRLHAVRSCRRSSRDSNVAVTCFARTGLAFSQPTGVPHIGWNAGGLVSRGGGGTLARGRVDRFSDRTRYELVGLPAGLRMGPQHTKRNGCSSKASYVVALRIGTGGVRCLLWHRCWAACSHCTSGIAGHLGHPQLLDEIAPRPASPRYMNALSQTTRSNLGLAASLILGSALLWWLLRTIDWALVWERGQSVSATAWCVGIFGLMASHLLRAARIRSEWSTRLSMGWRAAWGLLVTHSAWVVLAPMRAGEAAYVWALHQRGNIRPAAATLSLVKLRLQDMGILACFAAALWLPVPLVWRSLAALTLLALMFWTFPWVWQRVRARTKPADFSETPTPLKWSSWGFAISNWFVKLVAIGWPLSELSGLNDLTAFAAALGGEWGAAMPLQPPAGLGPYEAGVWAGAHLAHHATSLMVDAAQPPLPLHLPAAALVVHLMSLAVTVTSAALARLMGWSQIPFLAISPQ